MNFSFLLLGLFLGIFASLTNPAVIDDSKPVKIKDLLSVLKEVRAYSPLVIRSKVLQDHGMKRSINKFQESKLDTDLICFIIEFLDRNDLRRLSEISSEFFNMSNKVLNYKIDRILKYSNKIFCRCLINLDLSYENIILNADNLELVTYKSLLSSKSLECVMILTFLHEFLYGPDATLPNEMLEWHVSLAQKLARHSLSEVLQYSLEHIIPSYYGNGNDGTLRSLILGLKLLYLRPSPEQLIRMANLDVPMRLSIISGSNFEVRCAIINEVHPHISREEDWEYSIACMMHSNVFSRKFWNALKDRIHLCDPIFANRTVNKGFMWNKELSKQKLGDNDALMYLLTRSVVEPFNLQIFMSMNPEMIIVMKEFLYCSTPTLTEMDIFSQIYYADYFPIELIDLAAAHASGKFVLIMSSRDH